MEESIFSSDGRIRRSTFWLRWLMVFVINIIITVLQNVVQDNGLIFILIIFSLGLSIFMILQMIKRMHDVNKSGWYSIIPIYNIILAFTDGTPGTNDYGDDPKGRMTICSNCQTQNEPNAPVCINCGASLNYIKSPGIDDKTRDTYILIWFAWHLFVVCINVILPKFIHDWYMSPTKYIQLTLNVISALSFILIGLAVKDDKMKTIAFLIGSLAAILILYSNFVWIFRL
jgi:uncharacterized membrane protein YhaH (DUF805 family)